MSLVLNNKVSGTVADGTNSYVDVAYATDYFDNHWVSSYATQWNALAAQQQTNLLIAACRVIETARFTIPILHTDWRFHRYYNRLTMQVMNFQLLREPVKWYFYQVLQFPRNLDINPITGALFVPEALMMAQCEQAIYMLNFDQSALANRLQGVALDKISIGRNQIDLSQEYSGEGSQYAPQAFEMAKPYLVRGSKMRRA